MKTVMIAELKDHLSLHLRAVEAGEEIVVTDRRRPIARISPITTVASHVDIVPSKRPFKEVRDLPRPRMTTGSSSTRLLLDERRERERLRR